MMAEVTVQDFESWVYESRALQEALKEDDYQQFIEFNYKSADARYELYNLIEIFIEPVEFYQHYLLSLVEKLEVDDYQVFPQALMECYEIYCRGCDFLNDLGLGVGLCLVSPNTLYKAESWEELSEENKIQLVDSLDKKKINALISLFRKWVQNNEVQILRKDEDNLFIVKDNRSVFDKRSRLVELCEIEFNLLDKENDGVVFKEVEIKINGILIQEYLRDFEALFVSQEGNVGISGKYSGIQLPEKPTDYFLGKNLDEFEEEEGRVILDCGCCFTGCWPLAIRIFEKDDFIYWGEFQNLQRTPDSDHFWDYSGFGVFCFEKGQYLKALQSITR